MNVLVVAEHREGVVRDVTLEMVSAARELGEVTLAVIARDPLSLAQTIDVDGVAEILAVSAGADEFEPDAYTSALATLVAEQRPAAVLLPFSVNSMSFAPALAARLGLGFASDVHAVELREGAIIATRSFYGGKVAGEIEFSTATVLLTLRPTAWPQAAPRSGPPAPITSTTVDVGRARVRHVHFERPEKSQDVDIAAADFLLAIGRGIGDGDAIRQFEDLAERMKATLCASRPLVDAGWMPASRQVGQSGKTVKPKVYLAFGISGAVQHLAGMRGAGTVIAVNTDPDAAIFGVADYAAPCDLFDVADALEQLW